ARPSTTITENRAPPRPEKPRGRRVAARRPGAWRTEVHGRLPTGGRLACGQSNAHLGARGEAGVEGVLSPYAGKALESATGRGRARCPAGDALAHRAGPIPAELCAAARAVRVLRRDADVPARRRALRRAASDGALERARRARHDRHVAPPAGGASARLRRPRD